MRLVIVEGQEAGRQIPLERGLLIIGRGSDCGLVLLDTQASRHHAELRRFGEQWLIVDLGSTNGTYVSGVRQQANQARPLPPGVSVSIGDTTFVLEQERAGQGPADLYREAEAEVSVVARPTGIGWALGAWLARGLAAVGSVLLIAGSLTDWIQIQVSLPIVGRVLDRTYAGLDSNQGFLFIGAAALSLLLIVVDIASARWAVAAGLAQALLGAASAGFGALSVYQYYQLGQERILGINLLDLVQYARTAVHFTVQVGLILVVAGLAGLIVGGLLRLLLASLQPAGQSA